MKAAVLNIGNEVLMGHTINTNLATISKKVFDYGILVLEQRCVEDDEASIVEAVTSLTKKYDLLIISGGLGLTADDITSECVAKAFGRKMVFHKNILEEIEKYFINTGRKISENSRKQAYFPENIKIYSNKVGTASGFLLEEKDKQVLVLPGPPIEMETMLESFLSSYNGDEKPLMTTLNSFGIGESFLEGRLRKLNISKDLTINTYIGFNGVDIKIISKNNNRDQFLEAINKIKNEFGDAIYDADSKALSSSLLNKLIANKEKIAFAESCTGGKLASEFVKNSGASEALICSLVTYSEEAKMKELGVKEDTLKNFTAVSEETAREMLLGLRKKYDGDFFAVTTGYASPTGIKETEGLVFIGIYSKKLDKTIILRDNYKGNRLQIIDRVTANVYFNLLKLMN